MIFNSTIAALSTVAGHSAIAVVRVSGIDAIAVCEKIFVGKKLSEQQSHTAHFGKLKWNDEVIDEVLLTVFKAPHSFTMEDVVEISCHGSPYITQKIMEALLHFGAVQAKPGEFTQRAFLNGRFDLSQAEAVADLIASESAASHQLALKQMRGGFSSRIKSLRQQLIHLASLLELELDFSEEDVEFANRDELKQLIKNISDEAQRLFNSFSWGNVLKNGISTVIAGKPNAGKSTLLNAILNEERAIVSDIPGTTRDTIEEKIQLEGISFRFTDTAGLRESLDVIEQMGVQRSRQKIDDAGILIYLFDVRNDLQTVQLELEDLPQLKNRILVGNKTDLVNEKLAQQKFQSLPNVIFISAAKQKGIDALTDKLLQLAKADATQTDVVVTNLRHAQALQETISSLQQATDALQHNQSKELIAQHFRVAMHALGEITGEITNDDLLANIFSKFCIGK